MFKTKTQKLEAQIAELKNIQRDLQNKFSKLQADFWKMQDKNRAITNGLTQSSVNLANYKASNDVAVLNIDEDITDSQESISELAEMSDTNSSDITDCQEAISELMEIIEGGND